VRFVPFVADSFSTPKTGEQILQAVFIKDYLPHDAQKSQKDLINLVSF